MPDRLILPTRNILAVVSHGDQRQIKWFESATDIVNSIAEGATVSGGFLLDDGTATTDGGFLLDEGGA
jgi:hypothetical protein